MMTTRWGSNPAAIKESADACELAITSATPSFAAVCRILRFDQEK
jgi:hypothetical protein